MKVDIKQKKYYINRELSQLAFNQRVLELAEDTRLPLLERLKFIFIVSSNLDEFFEVRVAGLKDKQQFGSRNDKHSAESSTKTLAEISQTVHLMVERIYQLMNKDLLPALAQVGVHFIPKEKWSQIQRNWVKRHFRDEILPVLSPVGLDFAHPFPRLVNKSLNFIVSLEGKDAFGRDSGLAIVHAPRALPRVIKLPKQVAKTDDNFIFLTSIISAHVQDLFPGMSVTGCYQFRLTRNSDFYLEDESIEDLAKSMKQKLFSRHYGDVARLEISSDCPEYIYTFLLKKHNLTNDDLYFCDGPVNLNRYIVTLDLINRQDLRFPDFRPELPEMLEYKHNIFDTIRQTDILLHHPYQSFEPVLNLIRQATSDPNVIAIKQTLYRTGYDSPVVKALIQAAKAGKEVTAVIELRARFDEESNISLANHLQEAGALVIYGVVGFKTHAKMALVVRREAEGLVRYAHLSTGNYHENTSKFYTDFGLLTYQEEITQDVEKVFHLLTGMGKAYKLKRLLHSPFTLAKTLLDFIDNEIENAKQGKAARIIFKVNGLSDEIIIQALYRASQAGVKIDLIVRGICCLKPRVPGVSDNIRVKSILGRFLEHSRIYYFCNGGDEKIYCSSADLMERNLHYRVEVCFPILNPKNIKRVKQEGLMAYLADSAQSWMLKKDGRYSRTMSKKSKPIAVQTLLLEKLSSSRTP